MTSDDLNYLGFNDPLISREDGSVWYFRKAVYNTHTLDGYVEVFREMVVDMWGGFRYNDTLRFNVFTFLDTFDWPTELIWHNPDGTLKSEYTYSLDYLFIKKDKKLIEPYSIVNPNFHMLDV